MGLILLLMASVAAAAQETAFGAVWQVYPEMVLAPSATTKPIRRFSWPQEEQATAVAGQEDGAEGTLGDRNLISPSVATSGSEGDVEGAENATETRRRLQDRRQRIAVEIIPSGSRAGDFLENRESLSEDPQDSAAAKLL